MCDDTEDPHHPCNEVNGNARHAFHSTCWLWAEEWSYVGEGGRHAIFERIVGEESFPGSDAYEPVAGKRLPLASPQRILRVAKEDLARCGELTEAYTGPDADQSHIERSATHISSEEVIDGLENKIRKPDQVRNEFTSSMLGLLAPYIDRPRFVMLTCDVLRDLRRQALASGRIPPARLHMWAMQKVHSSSPAWGTLLRDYRVLQRCVPLLEQPYQSPTVCVEIKPKAGYLAVSPLVHPERRIKYRYSRFALLQELWKRGRVEKPWVHRGSTAKDTPQTIERRTSSYDPLSLFSGDPDRMSRALQSLFAAPQNNLKLWVRGKQLADGSNALSEGCNWGSLGRLLSMRLTDNIPSTLSYILSEILVHEPFLQRLLAVQRLDVLDGDGAILTYRRLVELCGGNHIRAETLLDDHSAMSKSHVSPHDLLTKSPFMPPDDASRIIRFCDVVQRTRDLIRTHSCDGDEKTEVLVMDKLHQQAKTLVGTLDVDDCRYLLQNWLLSLTMNDISFFLTLWVSDSCEGDGSQVPSTSSTKSNSVSFGFQEQSSIAQVWLQILSLQSSEELGFAMLSNEYGTKCSLQYHIKVIDWDPKPAKKLRDRESKEECFSCLSLGIPASSKATA